MPGLLPGIADIESGHFSCRGCRFLESRSPWLPVSCANQSGLHGLGFRREGGLLHRLGFVARPCHRLFAPSRYHSVKRVVARDQCMPDGGPEMQGDHYEDHVRAHDVQRRD